MAAIPALFFAVIFVLGVLHIAARSADAAEERRERAEERRERAAKKALIIEAEPPYN